MLPNFRWDEGAVGLALLVVWAGTLAGGGAVAACGSCVGGLCTLAGGSTDAAALIVQKKTITATIRTTILQRISLFIFI
jgi:hypothetical protein